MSLDQPRNKKNILITVKTDPLDYRQFSLFLNATDCSLHVQPPLQTEIIIVSYECIDTEGCW